MGVKRFLRSLVEGIVGQSFDDRPLQQVNVQQSTLTAIHSHLQRCCFTTTTATTSAQRGSLQGSGKSLSSDLLSHRRHGVVDSRSLASVGIVTEASGTGAIFSGGLHSPRFINSVAARAWIDLCRPDGRTMQQGFAFNDEPKRAVSRTMRQRLLEEELFQSTGCVEAAVCGYRWRSRCLAPDASAASVMPQLPTSVQSSSGLWVDHLLQQHPAYMLLLLVEDANAPKIATDAAILCG